jgi:hypothetical protein
MKIKGMKNQLCTMRKRKYEEQNLNNDYLIVESGSSKMSSSMSLDLFGSSMVWCKPKSADH